MDSDSDSSRDEVETSMEIEYKGDNCDNIIAKHFNLDAFATLSLSSSAISSELLNIRKNIAKNKKNFLNTYRKEDIQIELTPEDYQLRMNNDPDSEDNHNSNNNNNINEFERFYGTSIEAEVPQSAYLNFDLPAWEQDTKLNELLNQNQQAQLQTKTTLSDDIEKQFQLAPYRVSTRQRKKQNNAKNTAKLSGWFDMKRVTEITKEQQKDLDALEMRRVWNPKVFYKKNSGPASSRGKNDKAGFFQIGTVEQSSSDYYTDRTNKKDRKRTIVDELLADHELKSYNKRKLKYAMSKNSRLSMIHRRMKLKRAKQKIKARKFGRKGADPNAGVKSVTTY